MSNDKAQKDAALMNRSGDEPETSYEDPLVELARIVTTSSPLIPMDGTVDDLPPLPKLNALVPQDGTQAGGPDDDTTASPVEPEMTSENDPIVHLAVESPTVPESLEPEQAPIRGDDLIANLEESLRAIDFSVPLASEATEASSDADAEVATPSGELFKNDAPENDGSLIDVEIAAPVSIDTASLDETGAREPSLVPEIAAEESYQVPGVFAISSDDGPPTDHLSEPFETFGADAAVPVLPEPVLPSTILKDASASEAMLTEELDAANAQTEHLSASFHHDEQVSLHDQSEVELDVSETPEEIPAPDLVVQSRATPVIEIPNTAPVFVPEPVSAGLPDVVYPFVAPTSAGDEARAAPHVNQGYSEDLSDIEPVMVAPPVTVAFAPSADVAKGGAAPKPNAPDGAVAAPIAEPSRVGKPYKTQNSRAGFFIAAGFLAFLLLSGGLVWAFWGGSSAPDGPVRVVKAAPGDLKITPDAPVAEEKASDAGKVIYDRVAGNATGDEDQNAVIRSEPQITVITPTVRNEEGGVDTLAQQQERQIEPQDDRGPKLVETFTISPNGSVISSSSTNTDDAGTEIANTDQPKQLTSLDDDTNIISPVSPVVGIEIPASDAAAQSQSGPIVPSTTTVDLPQSRPANFDDLVRLAGVAPEAAPQVPTVQVTPTTPSNQPSVRETPTANNAGSVFPSSAQAASGTHLVQLSSRRSEEAALQSYDEIRSRFGSLFGPHQPYLDRADLGDRGVYYRVGVGPMRLAQANQVCSSVKQAGGDCFVRGR